MLVVLYICALWTLVNSAHLLAKRDDCTANGGIKGVCSTPLYGCGYDEIGSGPDCPSIRTKLGLHAECCIKVKCTDSKANGILDGFCSNGNCGEGRTKTFTEIAQQYCKEYSNAGCCVLTEGKAVSENYLYEGSYTDQGSLSFIEPEIDPESK